MRRRLYLLIFILLFVLSACSEEARTVDTQTENNSTLGNATEDMQTEEIDSEEINTEDILTKLTENINTTDARTGEKISETLTDKPEPTDSASSEAFYCFDASQDWDAKDYEAAFGQDLYYFSSPIDSPYNYTYQCEEDSMTIEEIAYKLGVIMMEDLMRNYEGKAFTVTEYKNLKPQVMSKDEVADWEDNYKAASGLKPVVIGDNQWLCSYQCQYKYTGEYSGIGEMPEDMDWMETLYRDGSGEKLIFIIQKVKYNEYIMRGLPKTIIVEMKTVFN